MCLRLLARRINFRFGFSGHNMIAELGSMLAESELLRVLVQLHLLTLVGLNLRDVVWPLCQIRIALNQFILM